MKRVFNTLIILLFVCVLPFAQVKDKLSLNGYLVNMQSASIMENPYDESDPQVGNVTLLNTYFLNRLNFYAYINENLTFSAQMRNRFLMGDQVRYDLTGQVKNSYEHNANFLDLSWNINSSNSHILNASFDRLYLEYFKGNWEFVLGKQRVNWGKTFVFNPNDMFNTYSYFDFDYMEKPGVDAAKAVFYTGATTSVEYVLSTDSAKQISSAIKWNLNVYNYDVQLIGGVLESNDLALGLGWSGYLKNASLRGEFAYYSPFERFNTDSLTVMMLSVGLDFSLGSNWTMQGEIMLSKSENPGLSIGNMVLGAAPTSVKNLAVTPIQAFVSTTYQASPASTVSFSVLAYPHKSLNAFYVGPSWNFSVSDAFRMSVYYQLFSTEFSSGLSENSRINYHAAFLRFSYHF